MLEPTSESQGHGKALEKDIQCNVYDLNPLDIQDHKHTEKYDIKQEYNHINNKNVSIKTSGSSTVYCGDVIRFLSSENMDIIIVMYDQTNDTKIASKTIVLDFNAFSKQLTEDIPKYCGIELEEWITNISNYVDIVKAIPPGKCVDKTYLKTKLTLCIPYFKINPKVDSKNQRRVQCSILLDKLPKEIKENKNTFQEFEGGKLFNKEYTKTIQSSCRAFRTPASPSHQ